MNDHLQFSGFSHLPVSRRCFLSGAAAAIAIPHNLPASALGAEGSILPSEIRPRQQLMVGFGQSDITPPVGAKMTGVGIPRSAGTDDPLLARTLVAQSGDRMLAIVGIDLVKIRLDLAEAAIAQASRWTGIERNAVLICY